jgi:hypothetical protein
MKTVLHYYSFDTKNQSERDLWLALCDKLRAMGLNCFTSYSKDHYEFYKDHIAPLDGKEVTLETEHLFDNQWNTAPTETSTSGLRVFDWAEDFNYDRRNFKKGMWLEQTEEMSIIRKETWACQYCGAQYHNPTAAFCIKCIGGEHLTEDHLHLLELKPIIGKYRTNGAVPESILTLYRSEQLIARKKRLEEAQKRKLEQLDKDIQNAIKEKEAFTWLIEHNVDFNNVIFYSHTDTFSFGWRNQLSVVEAEKLEAILLQGFSDRYKFEIKRQVA